jgi:dipeptidyl-peptidase-4
MSSMNYVDSNKIFMFGWSYGGYLTLMCMMQENSLIKGGVSIAPVTDWRYYDAIYTERYMRTPIANPVGYDKGSPVKLAERFKGNLLLIHGTADDNVHYQNSLELSKNLVQHNKIFQMNTYTNATHGISGSSTQLQLYTTITEFLMRMKE